MSFQEDFREFLDVEQGFAVEAIVVQASGVNYTIKGIFINDYFSIDGVSVAIAGEHPVFECAASSLKADCYGDLLIVNQMTYKIIAIKPDGTGWVVLVLEKQV